ncbi:cardiolipin synthase [Chryseobacterium sp. A321]
MSLLLILEILYGVLVTLVCLRIILDTKNATKSLAYVLFTIFVPVIGMGFYFLFGINYRHRHMYKKKLFKDEKLSIELRTKLFEYSKETYLGRDSKLSQSRELSYMLMHDLLSPLTSGNDVKILRNGEEKFPEVIKALKNAKNHIHLEYYIYNDDEIGNQIGDILLQKAKEGVKVRVIYDDFGSSRGCKKLMERLSEGGVEAHPFLKIYFIALANRINYRNHRKIILIDGKVGFVGGINISDNYINTKETPENIYWRDTHLKIEGPGVFYLQFLFLCDWNFCAEQSLEPTNDFFPSPQQHDTKENKVVQIASSGPDSPTPTILFSILQAINLAQKEILITSPYFIPDESLLNALIIASHSGIKIKLLVPKNSDSKIVKLASRSYYTQLLKAGVEIYLYTKGFVHAKTMVVDSFLAIVGTANMDIRSFDLNFEVNAVVYDHATAQELRNDFEMDLQNSERIDKERWLTRGKHIQLLESTMSLISPLL